jgi:hypothetical protein
MPPKKAVVMKNAPDAWASDARFLSMGRVERVFGVASCGSVLDIVSKQRNVFPT